MVKSLINKRYSYKNSKDFLFIIFAIFFLFALCTTFSFKISSIDGGYYQLQANAFLKGKIRLLIEPSTQLLALPNPYDPIQNGSYRLHDALLFHNHYYLYWGPVPAIVRILFFNQFPEQFFIFFYVTGCVILYYFIINKIKASYFPKINTIFFCFALISGCFNGAILNLLASSGIYYEAIAAAQFFFLSGFLFTTHYLSNKRGSYLFLSAIFYILSIFSRISYLFPCFFIGLYYLIGQFKSLIRKRQLRKLSSLTTVFLLFSPYLIGIFLICLYNFLRFGNFLEFGLQYQLAGIDMSLNYPKFTSIHNIPNNIQNYFFNLPTLISHLPFVSMNTKHYPNIERLVFSAFLISPITIFSLFLSKSSTNVTKIKYFLFLVFFLFVISVSLFSPTSATRYYFDFIFIFSLLGFVSLGIFRKNRIVLFSLFPLSVIFTFFALTMFLKAIQESHHQAYFNINKFIYSLTQNSNTIDKTAYADLTLVANKTNYLIINNAISRNATISLYPQTIQTYTILGQTGISLTFVSFESQSVSVNLSYQSHIKPKSIITSQPLVIHPGINKIDIQASVVPIELSNFELL